jgi:hypothetical protein
MLAKSKDEQKHKLRVAQNKAARRATCGNPNIDPDAFIGRGSEIKPPVTSVTIVFIDVSGSQGNQCGGETDPNRGTNMINRYNQMEGHPGIIIVPFGYPITGKKGIWHCGNQMFNITNPFWLVDDKSGNIGLTKNVFIRLIEQHGFNTGTFLNTVEYYIKYNLDINVPCNIVFQSDGDFSSGTKTLRQILEENQDKLHNVKTLTLALSPHTKPTDQLALEQALQAFIDNCNSYIVYESVLLQHNNPRELSSVIDKLPQQGTCVSAEWLAYRDLCIHTGLTHGSIAQELKNNYPDMIPLIIQDLKSAIKNRPELINKEASIYAKLYGALKILSTNSIEIDGKDTTIQKELLDYMSAYKTTLSSDSPQYKALHSLMEGSRIDPAMQQWQMYKLQDLPKVGYLTIAPHHIAKLTAELPDAIRDGSNIKLMELIKNLIANILYSTNVNPNSFGIPDIKECSAEDARSVLSILFQSIGIGKYTLQGAKLYWLAMGILITEVDINSNLRALAELACLDNEKYTLSALFDNEMLRNELFSQPMGYSLFKALTLYGSRMFPESINTPKYNTLIETLKAIYMVTLNYKRVLTTINTDMLIERTFNCLTESGTKLSPKKGSLCIVDPKSRLDIPNPADRDDPYPQFPSIIIVKSFEGKKHKGESKCGYLDYVLETDKDSCYIKNKYLTVIDYEPTQDTIDYINKMLIAYRAVCDATPDTRRAKLSKSSDEILVDIMKKINTTIQTITKTISIPPNVIKSLLLISPELRALDKKVYQLTKEDIMQFVELELSKRFDGCAIGTGVFEHEGTEIKLTESEIANIRQTFSQDSDFAKNIKGSKVSDLCYCTFCTEWVPNTTVHLASCGHSICKECNPPHTYRPGDLITKTRHVCYCGQVLDPDGLEELFGPGFTFKPNTVFRLCEEATCKAIVAHELTCGGTEEMCPMTCETHRPPSDIKYCPGCKAPTYHNGGCCHMTCRCNTHWCWFCGDGFPRQTIYSHMTDEHGGWYLPR